MTDVTPVPVFTAEPTGAMCHVLRRMLKKPLVTRLEGGRVVGDVGGERVSAIVIAAMQTRGLIAEGSNDSKTTTYTLTDLGRRWAIDPVHGEGKA